MNHKRLLMEQLVRIRMCGLRTTYQGRTYCVQCSLGWHGRRYSVTPQEFTTAGAYKLLSPRLPHFTQRNGAVVLWQNYRPLPQVVLRGRSYPTCDGCNKITVVQQPDYIERYINRLKEADYL